MKSILIATIAITVTSVAQAQVTFQVIGLGSATDISPDGSVVVGNTYENWETFRWTADTGIVPLGRATFPVLGSASGSPDVAADGWIISATILGSDQTYSTHGIYRPVGGWMELMPPTLPDGGTMESSYGSAWGLSDDGTTLVGFYWRPGQPGGLAHPSMWTAETGLVDLETPGGSGRANDANYDGSVIVGWVEDAVSAVWRPTVWVDGVRTILKEPEGFCEASAVTPDGTIIVGQSWETDITPFSYAQAAIWRWNEVTSSWDEELLGAVLGTAAPFGMSIANDVTADGRMVVGYNRKGSSAAADTGFIWTEEAGLVDVADFLADNGVVVPPDINLLSLTGVTDDGSRIVGIAQEMIDPFPYKWFIIDLPTCELLGDIDDDGNVSGSDIPGFVRAKSGQPPLAGEKPMCANYGGTLEEDIAAFIDDLLTN